MPYIPQEVFTNNPSTTVSSGGTSAPAGGTAETWTVASSAAFPVVEIGATQFHVADPALPSEVITVQNISGTTWTVMRGAEASTPVAHTAGFTVVQVVTAGALGQMQYEPWEFPVTAYQAQGDGKVGTGGTGASGQAVLTDAGASFVNAAAPAGDVGKVIVVNQGTGSATAGTNPFCGTILSVNSATSITLSANLAATCTAAPYCYGTDDAAAITAAVTAAANWAATTGNFKAQVIFGPQIYTLGALTQTTTQSWAGNPEGPYTYNTHIPVPFTGQYQRKLNLDFVGVGDASAQPFWGSATPSIEGTRLVSCVFPPAQPDATFGQMSVIGAPSITTGIGNGGITFGNFANVLINIKGIMAVCPWNGQQYGFDFRWASMANVDNGSAIAFAPVNYNAQTCGGPWMRATNIVSNGVAAGLAMPFSGNNDNINVGNFAVMGFSIGVMFSEHFTAQRISTVYCNRGLQVIWNPSVSSVIEGCSILYWDCEGGNFGLYTTQTAATAQFPVFIGSSTFEVMSNAYVYDPDSVFTGTMMWQDFQYPNPATLGITGGTGLVVINARHYPGPWAANANVTIAGPPAAPATTVAQQNISYRNATVYCSAATSITNTSVGPASGSLTALGQAAGAGVVIPVRVPSGHWYSVTYTGALTTKWLLE